MTDQLRDWRDRIRAWREDDAQGGTHALELLCALDDEMSAVLGESPESPEEIKIIPTHRRLEDSDV